MNATYRQLLPSLFIVLLLLAGLAVGDGHAQSKTTATAVTHRPLLSVKEMQQDLAILWAAFNTMHPAYGLYTTEDSMWLRYHATVQRICRPMREDEFMTAMYPLVSALKCGHTQVRHSVHYKPTAADRLPRLPFQVLVQNGRAWVTTHQLTTLQTGDELLRINDVPVKDIIQHGGDLYAADGNNQTFKELFLSEYDGFEDACNKYYRWKPPYHMLLRTADGMEQTLDADTLPATAPQAESIKTFDNYTNWSSSVNTGYLPLRFLKNAAVACFEVHSYQYEDTLIFKKAFKEIHEKGIKTLIIDLRHNTGGDIRIAAKLLTYLADAPFQMVGDLWARVPNPGKTAFTPYFDTAGTASFFQSFQPTGIKKAGCYQMAFQPAFGNLLGKTDLDKEDHFKGKLIVLIDGATFSSGAHTAAAIRQNCKGALFIGRETAGGAEGCSGGSIQALTLPHTRVVISFPLLRVVSVFRPATYGHGILPDHVVAYTPMDIVTQKDVDLLRALEVIHATAE
ncbi:S41 family peptidase [Chitinophaga nivalis]|uniref:S41 family peptidase n=1 Tax=Chitinophaga nivalis TaxID=2991709 RepID=A0ABT3IJM4_9BACT|nr:S41 family peptidase [Chitinophaga nivalis]MCW3466165.1 S41 family peptidase [Chitinophaga nivalis]MCW3484144.1 S41 family peptidase [Chitinophaga nivalis]